MRKLLQKTSAALMVPVVILPIGALFFALGTQLNLAPLTADNLLEVDWHLLREHGKDTITIVTLMDSSQDWETSTAGPVSAGQDMIAKKKG